MSGIDANIKSGIIQKYRINEKDTGSAFVQVALLTERIKYLTEHLKVHKKDFSTRHGLLKLVGQRSSLLKYVADKDYKRYEEFVKELGIRQKL